MNGGLPGRLGRAAALLATLVVSATGCEEPIEIGPDGTVLGEPPEAPGFTDGVGAPKWHRSHSSSPPWPHILTCYGGCAPPHYDSTACNGSTACCSHCIDGTWWYSTEQTIFGCGAKLEIRRGDRCCVVEVADNGPADFVEDNAASRCGTSEIIDASPLVHDYLGGGCGWSECFRVDVRPMPRDTPTGPCASCPCGCTPTTETCDNRDDDCDGTTDEGLSRDCGSDVGECRRGTQGCSRGAWGACSGVEPQPEVCDAGDDDCDGRTDEDLSRRCGTDVGECEFGHQECAAGVWGECLDDVEAVAETCDALDNDCDDQTDEDRVCEIEEVTFQSPLYDWGGTSDVDGDGKADLCARTAGGFRCLRATGRGFDVAIVGPELPASAGWNDPSHYATLRTGDIDGDGRADVCARGPDGMACWRSTGTSFGAQVGGPALSDAAGWDRPEYDSTIRLADFTGDGRADICARSSAGFQCHPSSGTGFGAAIVLDALSDANGWDEVQYYGSIRMGDVDGDGRADVCARGPDGVACWLSDGVRFGPRLTGPAWTDAHAWTAVEYWSTIRLADVNADGRADLCGRTASDFRCHLSDGESFGGPLLGPALSDAAGWNRPERFSTIRLDDVNGDEAVDLCARDAAGIACWLWTGAGFDRRIAGPALSDADGWTARPYYRTIRIADVNGDGRADVCARAVDGVSCWLSDGSGFPVVVPGPPWTDADGWTAPRAYATIRLSGPPRGPAFDLRRPGSSGCACGVSGGSSGAGGFGSVCMLLAAVWRRFARRRRSVYGCRMNRSVSASFSHSVPVASSTNR